MESELTSRNYRPSRFATLLAIASRSVFYRPCIALGTVAGICYFTLPYFTLLYRRKKNNRDGSTNGEDNVGMFPIDLSRIVAALKVLGCYFNKEDIREMLMKNKGAIERSIRETDCFLKDILYLEELLGRELFHVMLLSKYENGETRLHRMMKSRAKLFVRDLDVYASFLNSHSLRDFLFSQAKYDGNTFLHKWAAFYKESHGINILHGLHSILSPDTFEQLLNARNNTGQTFIHLFNGPLSELSFLYEFLGYEKLIELVTAKRDKGRTRLYDIRYDMLSKNLKFYSKLLDESSLRDFVLTKDKNGKTFCYDNFSVISDDLKSILSPNLFKELQNTLKKC